MRQHFLSLSGVLFALATLVSSSVLAQDNIPTALVSGTGWDDEEGPKSVCDGQMNTKWCVDEPSQMPYTIVLDAGRSVAIQEYGLATGNDTAEYPSRNPVGWRLSGSNDMKAWTLLDEQNNNRSLPAENYSEYRFRTREKGQYRYYRFEFLRLTRGTRIQLSEISLYDKVQMPARVAFVSGTGSGTKEGAEMVCDGHLYSKWCIDAPRQMPYAVVLDASEPIVITEYRFATGDDTHTYPQRNPITWRLSGSNDQQSWTLLDEQKGNRRLRDENEQEYRFKPKASGSYRYYRFEFLRMAEGTRLQLSEIRLFK